jgi:hypothetical protein
MPSNLVKWLLLLGAAVLVLAAGIVGISIMGSMQPQTALTYAVIFGVILLLATLTLVALAFSLLKMNDNTQALALPEGSVRAIIALSLLVIFVMLTVYMYSDQASNVKPEVLSGLSQQQVDAIPKEQLIGKPSPDAEKPGTSSVIILLPRNQVSADFSKQIFTAISTMVISIAAFYFGTRAVASARSAVATSAPELTSVDPAKVASGNSSQSVTIHGTGFDNPSVVKFMKDGKELNISDMTCNPTKIVGNIPALTASEVGQWSCVVVNGDGGAATALKNALEVAPPPSNNGSTTAGSVATLTPTPVPNPAPGSVTNAIDVLAPTLTSVPLSSPRNVTNTAGSVLAPTPSVPISKSISVANTAGTI